MTWLWIDHLRHAGDRAGDDVLEARVGGRGHRHRVALAGQADGDPQDVGGDRLRLGLVRYELDCRHQPLLSTDPRQRVAHELVHDPLAAERRLHEHHRLAGSVFTSPISAACSNSPARRPRAARRARRRRARGRRPRRARPRWRRASGRSRAAPPPRPPTGGTGTAASRTSIATPEARASSLRTDATPPRVASRRQRRPGPAVARAARRPRATAAACRTRSSAPSSNSPRASMIAVPCVADRAGDEDPVAGAQRRGRQPRARSSTRPMPGRADVHLVGVAALDDLRVAGDDRARRRRAPPRRSPRPRRAARRPRGPPRG